jgi:hypothetical protein
MRSIAFGTALVSVCSIVSSCFEKIFYGKVLYGEGIVIDCCQEEKPDIRMFFPYVLQPCQEIPESENPYLVTLAFGGEKYVVKKDRFFHIGRKVKVIYQKGTVGIRIINIKETKKCSFNS